MPRKHVSRRESTPLGALLVRARESRPSALSLRELARLIDASPTYVSRVERGECHPAASWVVRVAEVLGEDVDVWLRAAGHVPQDILATVRNWPGGYAPLRGVLAREARRLAKARGVSP
jgi:transcriptional regulator with XRE-family HTH domain